MYGIIKLQEELEKLEKDFRSGNLDMTKEQYEKVTHSLRESILALKFDTSERDRILLRNEYLEEKLNKQQALNVG